VSNNIEEMPNEELRELLQSSRQTITSLVDSVASRPDMQNAIRRLMSPDDMLATFSELVVKEPDLMRLVLQGSVAALVNVQSVEAVDAELKRRAISGN
jgi:hypothetical protein